MHLEDLSEWEVDYIKPIWEVVWMISVLMIAHLFRLLHKVDILIIDLSIVALLI